MSELSGAIDEFMGQMISKVALMIVSSLVALIILYLVTSLAIEENRSTISLLRCCLPTSGNPVPDIE